MNNSIIDASIGIDALKTGDNIHYFRKAKKLSQMNLAEMVGVSPRTINNWEQGHKSFSVIHLVRLSYVLGVKTDDILCSTAEDVVLFFLYNVLIYFLSK